MPKKQLNSYQLELRSPENTARLKRVAANNQHIFTLAERSERERKRRFRLVLEQKLARRPQENTSQEVIKFPEQRISYLEGLFLGIIIVVLLSLFPDFVVLLNPHKTLLISDSFQYHQMKHSETTAITVDEDGLEDPNFDGLYNGKEIPQLDVEDPYAYLPYLPQTESEVKSAVEDLTQKIRIEGMARRQNSMESS
jgi:hypothetical protein